MSFIETDKRHPIILNSIKRENKKRSNYVNIAVGSIADFKQITN